MAQTQDNTQSMEPLLEDDDVEQLLKISSATISRLVRDGGLPVVRIRGRRLYEPAAVRAFIAERRSSR